MDEQPEQPDRRLTFAERRQARMARRVEKWEERMAAPPPPRHLHRAIITVVMLVAMLVLAYVIAFTNPNG